MKNPILFLLPFAAAAVLLSAVSCHSGNASSESSDSAKSPVTQLSGEIESLHEKTMNKIAPMRRMEDSLHAHIIRIAAQKGDTTQLTAAAARLNSCDTTMFGWMGRYDMQLEGKTDSGKAQYLRGQVAELTRIDQSIDSAIAEAKGLLGNQ